MVEYRKTTRRNHDREREETWALAVPHSPGRCRLLIICHKNAIFEPGRQNDGLWESRRGTKAVERAARIQNLGNGRISNPLRAGNGFGGCGCVKGSGIKSHHARMSRLHEVVDRRFLEDLGSVFRHVAHGPSEIKKSAWLGRQDKGSMQVKDLRFLPWSFGSFDLVVTTCKRQLPNPKPEVSSPFLIPQRMIDCAIIRKSTKGRNTCIWCKKTSFRDHAKKRINI